MVSVGETCKELGVPDRADGTSENDDNREQYANITPREMMREKERLQQKKNETADAFLLVGSGDE